MTEDVHQDLIRRLDLLDHTNRHLARRNRTLLATLAATPLVVFSLFVGGGAKPPDPPKVIEAEEFVLRGPDGSLRAALSCEETGGASLSLYQEEKLRIGVHTQDDGVAVFEGFDSKGQIRFHLGVDPHGNPSLALRDKNDGQSHTGLALVSLSVQSDSSAGLDIFEPSIRAKRKLRLWSHADGGIGLTVFGGQDAAVDLGIRQEGTPGLTMVEPTRKNWLGLGFRPDRTPELKIVKEKRVIVSVPELN